MQLYLNDNATTTRSMNIAQLVQEQVSASMPGKMAVALNGVVVPRSDWALIALKEKDKVDVFYAVVGG